MSTTHRASQYWEVIDATGRRYGSILRTPALANHLADRLNQMPPGGDEYRGPFAICHQRTVHTTTITARPAAPEGLQL